MKGKAVHRAKDCRLCRNGDRNIYAHRNWMISIYLDYLPAGQREQRITKKENGQLFQSGADCIAYWTQIQPQIEAKKYFPYSYVKSKASHYLWEQVYDEYVKPREAPYFRRYAKFYEAFIGKDVRSIGRGEIQKLYESLPKEFSDAYRSQVMTILHACLVHAWRRELIPTVPPFPVLRKTQKEKKWISWEDQKRIIECADEQSRPYLLFLACHGVRPGLGSKLRWEDFDLKTKEFRIQSRKGGVTKITTLPVHSLWLESIKVVGMAGEVFDPKIYYRLTQTGLTALCEKAGVKVVTLHEFSRHSMISGLLNAGYTKEQVALITDNLSAMGSYAHTSIEAKRALIESRTT